MNKVTYSGPLNGPINSKKKDADKAKEDFASKARTVRDRFFALKKSGRKPSKSLTPMQRRMQSGGV